MAGITGTVAYEDAEFLWIKTKKGIKKVPKKICRFLFRYRSVKVAVDGRLLAGPPEDRIKRGLHLLRKWRIPRAFFK